MPQITDIDGERRGVGAQGAPIAAIAGIADIARDREKKMLTAETQRRGENQKSDIGRKCLEMADIDG